jgi:hypothetical protein
MLYHIGNALQCRQVSDLLLQEYGQYVQAINYPTVPEGQENAYSSPSTCKHVPSDSAVPVYTVCISCLYKYWVVLEVVSCVQNKNIKCEKYIMNVIILETEMV